MTRDNFLVLKTIAGNTDNVFKSIDQVPGLTVQYSVSKNSVQREIERRSALVVDRLVEVISRDPLLVPLFEGIMAKSKASSSSATGDPPVTSGSQACGLAKPGQGRAGEGGRMQGDLPPIPPALENSSKVKKKKNQKSGHGNVKSPKNIAAQSENDERSGYMLMEYSEDEDNCARANPGVVRAGTPKFAKRGEHGFKPFPENPIRLDDFRQALCGSYPSDVYRGAVSTLKRVTSRWKYRRDECSEGARSLLGLGSDCTICDFFSRAYRPDLSEGTILHSIKPEHVSEEEHNDIIATHALAAISYVNYGPGGTFDSHLQKLLKIGNGAGWTGVGPSQLEDLMNEACDGTNVKWRQYDLVRYRGKDAGRKLFEMFTGSSFH